MATRDPRAAALERLSRANRVQVAISVQVTQRVAARSGVNITDLQCLNLLSIFGPMTPTELAEALAMTRGGAVTAVIDRLEKAGRIRRARTSTDRRRVHIELVDDEQLDELAQHFRPIGELFESVTAGYTDEQLAFLADYLEHSNAAFGIPHSSQPLADD